MGSDYARLKYHVVRRGDTLWDIAKAYGVTVGQLRAWNGNSSSRNLRPGTRLVVATAGKAAPPSRNLKRYTVRKGDTLWEISRVHGVKVNDLMTWNSLEVASAIQPGDRLKIWTSQ